VTQIRVGYEAADWAETALDLAGDEHPLFVAAVGAAARGAWNRGDFARARALAGREVTRCRHRSYRPFRGRRRGRRPL
jgi:hypothetical protein